MNTELYIQVQSWHRDKNLTHKDNLLVQSMKLIEEFSEFQSSKIKYIFNRKNENDKNEVIDAVGDSLICCSAVLDILRELTGKQISLQRLIEKIPNEDIEDIGFENLTLKISQETLKLKYDDLIETIRDVICYICKESRIIRLNSNNLTFLEYCLEVAFNVIKDRKGKNVNGNFIKSEDLQ